MASCSRPSSESTIMMKPNWLELPREVIANILERVGAIEIVTSVRQVCPLWWDIWRVIDMGKKEASHYKDEIGLEDVLSGEICGIKLSDVGLSAIVDGCPLLESLDLRRCIYFELLDESLEIKYLRFPYMSDYDDD
ncbi:Leucine-rich repeat domain superfamily [Sesbania bispinosa]|nr:Leucine-rich repeat domain superfamily [Sesbania bispinosa]